ncbi:MAG: hypothetical protein P8Y69_17030 [Gammaproteobacteria bacterium]
MRSRAIEITSAIAGAVIVAVLYVQHANEAARSSAAEPVNPPIDTVALPAPAPTVTPIRQEVPAPSAPNPVEPAEQQTPIEDPSGPEPVIVEREWQAAAAEVDRVVTELKQVDVRFDAIAADYRRREASGEEDPEALDEELRARLKEVLGVYNELEKELVVVERHKAEAEARLRAVEAAAPASAG